MYDIDTIREKNDRRMKSANRREARKRAVKLDWLNRADQAEARGDKVVARNIRSHVMERYA